MSTLLSCSRAHNKTEPGYYADGEYGTRIENVVIVREAQTPNNFGNKGFLGFEHVTMVFPFRLTALERADQPSRRSLWGETSSTCLSSPWTNGRGWMRIIKRYGRKYLDCLKETQGLKRGCIASAHRLTLDPGGILARTRVVSSLFVGSGKQCRCDHHQLIGRNMTGSDYDSASCRCLITSRSYSTCFYSLLDTYTVFSDPGAIVQTSDVSWCHRGECPVVIADGALPVGCPGYRLSISDVSYVAIC